jgi:hypothetical protein
MINLKEKETAVAYFCTTAAFNARIRVYLQELVNMGGLESSIDPETTPLSRNVRF